MLQDEYHIYFKPTGGTDGKPLLIASKSVKPSLTMGEIPDYYGTLTKAELEKFVKDKNEEWGTDFELQVNGNVLVWKFDRVNLNDEERVSIPV